MKLQNLKGSVLFEGTFLNLKRCVEAAISAGADLRGADLAGADLRRADLAGADLRGADLRGADLAGADLIDGGQDRRSYRFWAWRYADELQISAGCQQWASLAAARAHYGETYSSNGNRAECLKRIDLIAGEARDRWGI